MVRHSAVSLSFSVAVNSGSVANACQYLRAAFAARSGGGSAAAGDEDRTRMVKARDSTRGMGNTSHEEPRGDGVGEAGWALGIEQVSGDGGRRDACPPRPDLTRDIVRTGSSIRQL